MEALYKRYSLIIAGDLNLNLDHGDKGRAMHELCVQFSMDMVNEQNSTDDPDSWTLEFQLYLLRLY